MDYEPNHWSRAHLYRGFLFMFVGVICYVAATYMIFLLESTWLQISLGSSTLALSVMLIAIGFNTSNTKRHVKRQSYSEAVRSTRSGSFASSVNYLERARKSSHD